jgi:tetratricopeptide (TPR) repeat protein
VEKSLVEVSAGEYRYRLLATIRQYALARLDESAEGESVRKRHFDFYLAAAERATLHLRGPAARTWFAQIDLERDNIIAALAWCQAAEGRTESALRLGAATARYWSYGGMMELGYRLTVEALSSRSASMQSRARGAALEAAGNLGSYLGRYVEAHRYGEESLAIARAEGDEEGVIAALILSGWASHARGNLAEARIRGQEALDLSRKLGGQPSLNSALNGLAELYRAEGDLSAAERCYEEAMAVARELDYPSSIAAYLVNLAMVSIERGSGDRARRMLAEAGAIAERIGGKRMAWGVLDVSAGLAATIGQWIRAARFLGAAEAEREAMKLHRDPADEAFLTPLIRRTREALGESQFAAAVAEGRALTFGDGMAEAREWLEHPT